MGRALATKTEHGGRSVDYYHGALRTEATGEIEMYSKSPAPSAGGDSESRRYEGLEPLAWYTFTVTPRFSDGTDGTTGTVRGQAPDEVPPLFPVLTGCDAVEAALAAGERVSYTGQCHADTWTYFTHDARAQGGVEVLINPEDAGTFVCGHDNETALDDGLWCSSNAEWALVGESS